METTILGFRVWGIWSPFKSIEYGVYGDILLYAKDIFCLLKGDYVL